MSFERQDHLVYGRRGDLEVLLHFGLRRWGPVDFAVVVIKGIGINKCARESGFDRKNFIRKLIRGNTRKT
jgi:hypothetical protein